MITYDELIKKPRVFKSLTGVTPVEFDDLLTKVRPIWLQQEYERLNRPDRQRSIGGGGDYKLALRERLLMSLSWLRLYLNTEALGYCFGVDKSTASRNTRNLLSALRQVGDETLGWPEPPQRGQGKGIDQALRDYPDLWALIDATEQPVQRSGDHQTQQAHYSGKKKRHTRKTQLIVNEYGQIRDVSRSTPGSPHDLNHFRQSGAAARIPKELTAGGDAGYQGLQAELPDHSVITPFKASKNRPLTAEEKWLNQEFSRTRIVVENTICQLKHFKVLAERFRHTVDSYDDVFRSVVAIVNPRIARRLTVA
ncbi:MAG TPA: transposase family protein [Anaerolineae bacterium]|nr:transposase family protein [Anaerolineae bacterium]